MNNAAPNNRPNHRTQHSYFPPYAYDDDLIASVQNDARPRVRVYRLAAPVVVLGSGSRPELEINLAACRDENIPVLRRHGGGCAVLLDPGNVIVSTVAAGLPFGGHLNYFDQITEWLIAGLDAAGFPGVSKNGICDLVLDDKKIGGACMHRRRDLLYYSVSLLVNPDLDAVTRCLKHPPREPEYRRARSHADFMGALSSTQSPADPADFADKLRRILTPPLLKPPAPRIRLTA